MAFSFSKAAAVAAGSNSFVTSLFADDIPKSLGICPSDYVSVYGQNDDSNFKICKSIIKKEVEDGFVVRWTRIMVYNKETKKDVEFPRPLYEETFKDIKWDKKYLDILGLEEMENARYEDGFLYFNGKMKYGRGLDQMPNYYVNENQLAETYTGEFKNTKRHGNGILICKNGDEYTGKFKDNKMDGLGKMIYANGDIYEGEWSDGKPNGYGKMFYKKGGNEGNPGDIYDGEWLNGIRHGQGKMVFSKPDIDGQIANAYGKVVPSPISFEWWVAVLRRQRDDIMPTFVKPLQGERTASYEGEFRDNKINGYGTMIFWNASSKYQGNFKDNKMDGDGIMIYANGHTYKGEWKNNEMIKVREGTKSRRIKQKRRIRKSIKKW